MLVPPKAAPGELANSASTADRPSNSSGPRLGKVRWTICGLLFAATTINYIDRQVVGLLKPVLTDQYHWTQIEYGNIVFAFQLAYAIGLLGVGYVLDRVGVRVGFAVAVGLWSLAAMGHGLIQFMPSTPGGDGAMILGFGTASVIAFAFARFLLGIAESANFPACIKTIAVWFPKKERAYATGIANAGANIGAIVTPLSVPYIVKHWGWPAAFYITGGVGLFWILAWLKLYANPDQHPNLTAAERDHIHSDAEDLSAAKLPWIEMLRYKQTWAFAIGKFLTDPVWWFYLFWVPDFLHTTHGLDITKFGPPLVVIYVISDFGSIAGGWLSSNLMSRGWSVNAGRKTALLVSALCVVPIIGAARTNNVWTAVLLIGLAAAGHQGWSANIFTFASDIVPRRALSSVIGFGGMAGAVGGMVVAKFVGYILDKTNNSYIIPFTIAGTAYLLAFVIMHLMVPKSEPIVLRNEPGAGGLRSEKEEK